MRTVVAMIQTRDGWEYWVESGGEAIAGPFETCEEARAAQRDI